MLIFQNNGQWWASREGVIYVFNECRSWFTWVVMEYITT